MSFDHRTDKLTYAKLMAYIDDRYKSDDDLAKFQHCLFKLCDVVSEIKMHRLDAMIAKMNDDINKDASQ